MKKVEKRDVEVKYCDVCEEEITNYAKCQICGSDLCANKCTVFSIEIYRYGAGDRIRGHVCKNCKHLVELLVTALENSH